MKKFVAFAFLLACVALTVCFFFFFNSEEKQTSCVIVGAGPAGSATAIACQNQGLDVTLIEKRKSYTRNQVLFLDHTTLKLLDKWKVSPSQLVVSEIGNGEKIGFVPIKNLEEALEYRTKVMGIKKIQGEFKDFQKGKSAIQVLNKNNEMIDLSYDFLVAADGAKSSVREKLGITMQQEGEADALWAVVPLKGAPATSGISEPILKNDYFIRRIQTPFVSILFIQSTKKVPRGSIEKELFTKLIREAGFEKEAEVMAKGGATFSEPIVVTLQQASTFSDPKKSAILVGDACATASFFQGKGANTALKTAMCAEAFFKMIKENKKEAYNEYNVAIKEVTDEMLDDSRFLFRD